MALKVQAVRNDDSGLIELGAEQDGHFVAIATMPTTQFDSTVENLKAAANDAAPSDS